MRQAGNGRCAADIGLLTGVTRRVNGSLWVPEALVL